MTIFKVPKFKPGKKGQQQKQSNRRRLDPNPRRHRSKRQR